MPLTVGLDLGTTHCKGIALDEAGTVVASESGVYPLYTPHAGWVEQDAHDIWQGVIQILQKLAMSVAGQTIVGLGLSGAMHTLLPVDVAGNPLARAMTWADTRAGPQLAVLSHQIDVNNLYQRTGCPLQLPYHLPRLHWWATNGLDNVRFVSLKDWVLYRLCKVWVTDLGMASTTGLLNIHHHTWDEEALRLGHLEATYLPELVTPEQVVGQLNADVAQLTGLSPDLPIVAGSSDGALAMVGAGVVNSGQAVITVGTSAAIRHVVSTPQLDTLARTWCYHFFNNTWLAGGAINNAGLALAWLQRHYYADLPADLAYQKIFKEASEVTIGAEGLLFLPYLSGERSPHWQPDLRATLFGLGLNHERRHIARAVLEGIAFCLKDVWHILFPEKPQTVCLTSRFNQFPLWPQLLTDVLGQPLFVADKADASALGTAQLAWMGVGKMNVIQPSELRYGQDLLVQPKQANYIQYQTRYQDFQQLYQQL